MATMPREAWQNTVQRQGYGGERLRASDFGSGGEMIGRAVEGFGQDIKSLAANLTEIEKQDAETAAREADNVRVANRLKRFYEGPEGYFNQEGKNALLDRPKLDEDLKRIDADAAKLLEHKPFARKLFDDMTLRRNSDDLPRIASHEYKQRDAYETQVDADAFDLAIDNATSATDPVAIEQNIATVQAIAERQARRKGMTDENTITQARQAATGKAVEAIAQRMELDSPAEAQAFVKAHAGDMDPQDAGKLLEGLANPAAQERAGSDIGNFLVLQGFPNDVPATAVANQGASEGPKAGPTPIPTDDVLDAAQFTSTNSQESGGVHRTADGKLLRSEAGALGISQVLVATGYDPGYGVKPLQNQSREEYLRFGRDYRNALIKHYGGNVVLGLTAYNWGPKNVDAHIAKVGDPSKGQISDAAFINSIPVKEAREYAPGVLNKAGVSISGVTPTGRARPVQVGQEIDIDATINNIRNSDRSFVDKQALIAEAQRLHGYGKQVRAEQEEQLKDDAWTAVNGMKEFTDYNQLPLSLRNRLKSMPELEHSFRQQAESNKSSEMSEQAQEDELDLLELQYTNPQRFATEIDFRTQFPSLTYSKRIDMMNKQEAIRKSMAGGSEGNRVDYDAMRKEVNRFRGQFDKDKDLGVAYDLAIRKAEAWIRDNPGKALPDAVRQGIAREVMMPVTVQRPGTLGFGTRSTVVPQAELEAERGKKPVRNIRVDPTTQVRAELEQLWGRTPSDAEVAREVALRVERGTYKK